MDKCGGWLGRRMFLVYASLRSHAMGPTNDGIYLYVHGFDCHVMVVGVAQEGGE